MNLANSSSYEAEKEKFKDRVEEGQDQIELRLLSEAKSQFASICYPAGVDACDKLEKELP